MPERLIDHRSAADLKSWSGITAGSQPCRDLEVMALEKGFEVMAVWDVREREAF